MGCGDEATTATVSLAATTNDRVTNPLEKLRLSLLCRSLPWTLPEPPTSKKPLRMLHAGPLAGQRWAMIGWLYDPRLRPLALRPLPAWLWSLDATHVRW